MYDCLLVFRQFFTLLIKLLSGLRGNDLRKDDVESLRCALVSMPNLEILDISDNPIEDDGIRLDEFSFVTSTFNVVGKSLKAAVELCRCLIPYIMEAPDRCSPLAELYLENCELSCSGATELLDSLSNLKRPLNSLSLADNGLGRFVCWLWYRSNNLLLCFVLELH